MPIYVHDKALRDTYASLAGGDGGGAQFNGIGSKADILSRPCCW